MINDRTLTTAIQSSNTQRLLDAYRQYTGNSAYTSSDLFAFITTPTAQRQEFLSACCTCTYTIVNNTVIPNYTAL